MSESNKKREWTYSRVSIDRLNVDNQERLLEAYRASRKPSRVEKASEVISGRKMSGERLKELWDAVLKDEVSRITVVALDRLGRNLLQALHFVKDCLEHDVEINVLTYPNLKLNTPEGKLVFHVMMAMAEHELNLIKDRTARGLETAALTCKQCGHWEASHKKHPNFKCAKCGATVARFKPTREGKCWLSHKIAAKVPEILRLHDAGFTNKRIKEMLGGDERTIARVINNRDNLPTTLERKWDK